MSYFNSDYRKPRFFFLSIILVSLISAFVGGLIALSFVPETEEEHGSLPPAEEDNSRDFSPPDFEGDWPVVDIAKRVGPAVVGVTSISSQQFFNQPAVSSGSGVIIDNEKGHIVTNYHVIQNAREIKVSLNEEQTYDARRIGYDQETDLAVLQIDAAGLPEAKLGNSEDLRVGELVVAIGNPLGKEFARSVTAGVISALNREITVGQEDITLEVVQTDAAINPGNSGGALVNSRGEVIGINSLKIARADVEGMGFAIPISDALPIINQLIEQGYVSRAYLGIYEFQAIDPEIARYYGIPRGILIGGVINGSPADEAGLRPRDIILSIDGKKTLTLEDLKNVLNEYEVGDRVTLEIMRNNDRLTMDLELGERPRGNG